MDELKEVLTTIVDKKRKRISKDDECEIKELLLGKIWLKFKIDFVFYN